MAEPSSVPIRVLLVDDDAEILSALTDLLELETGKYQVQTATSTFGAIIAAHNFRPDVALIDIRLGSASGLNLIPILKNNLRDIVCVVMTAYRNTDYAVQAIRSGADEYLHKPIDAENLLETLSALVSQQRKKKQEQGRVARTLEIFDEVSQMLFVLKTDGRVVDLNRSTLWFFGAKKKNLIGQPIDAFAWPRPAGATELPFTSMIARAKRGEVVSQKMELKRGDSLLTFDVMMKPLLGSDGQVDLVLLEVRDITETQQKEEHLRRLAQYDPLTGLANRALFNDRLLMELSHARRHERLVGLLFIDCDFLKKINDTHGHIFGDQVLAVVAERLRECVREEDTVARLGGDEFAVILTEFDQSQRAEEVAQRIVAAVRRPITLGIGDLTVSVSVGVALFPEDGGDGETLLTRADTAMYRAKQSGRNTYRFFS